MKVPIQGLFFCPRPHFPRQFSQLQSEPVFPRHTAKAKWVGELRSVFLSKIPTNYLKTLEINLMKKSLLAVAVAAALPAAAFAQSSVTLYGIADIGIASINTSAGLVGTYSVPSKRYLELSAQYDALLRNV